jgi:hypothetical protein
MFAAGGHESHAARLRQRKESRPLVVDRGGVIEHREVFPDIISFAFPSGAATPQSLTMEQYQSAGKKSAPERHVMREIQQMLQSVKIIHYSLREQSTVISMG